MPAGELALPIGAEPPGPMTLGRRLREFFRPPRTLRITPVGRTYLIVTLGVGLGALNTGNNLLYLVLGLQLSLIVVSGVLSERCLRGLKVRRIGADAAFAGEPFAFRWALSRNDGHAFALEVSEVNPDLQGGAALAHLGPGAEVIVRGDLLAQRRGPHCLSAIRVTTQFPLGLFAKTREYDVDGTLVIYPKRVPPPKRDPRGADGDDGQVNPLNSAGGTGEVVALAPYRDGDDARRIHWLRSATLGQVVRIERAREERRTCVLRSTVHRPGEKLERECERLSAEARALLAQGHEVGLETETVHLRPSGGPAQEKRLLRALAHVGFAEDGADVGGEGSVSGSGAGSAGSRRGAERHPRPGGAGAR